MTDETVGRGGELIPRASDNSTLMALTRAEIDMQVTTAKAYPRSLEQFRLDVMAMATVDEETAESMYYVLPRDGKTIEGPSVRLAEIAGSCWGNVRYGARVIEVGDEYLVARGACYDLQRNVAIEIDVRRRITKRDGSRFNADMIQTAGLAACAIALRNSIFKVVPAAYIKPVLEKAKQVAAGDAKSLEANRTAVIEYFEKKGIKAERLFQLFGVRGKSEIMLDHIGKAKGIVTAIKDGEAKMEDFFPAGAPATVVKIDSLAGAKVTGVNGATPGAEPVASEPIKDETPAPAVVSDDEIAKAAAAFTDGAAVTTAELNQQIDGASRADEAASIFGKR